MKDYINHWKTLFIGIIVVLLLAGLCIPVSTLVVIQRQSDHKLYIPMVFDRTFSYYYLHSVQKTPVQEHFVLAPGNKILLTSTHYQSYGVGLPFLPEEGTLVNDNGMFLLTGINRKFEEINFGFMPLADQALLYHGKRYDFYKHFDSGALLQIKVQKYSPVKLIWMLREGGQP